MVLNPCGCLIMDDFLSSRKDKTKDVSIHSFNENCYLPPSWSSQFGDSNEIITQMNVMPQRSNKDALKAHSGTLRSQGGQGRLAWGCGATRAAVSNCTAEWCSEKAILHAVVVTLMWLYSLRQHMSKRSFCENKNARVRLRCVCVGVGGAAAEEGTPLVTASPPHPALGDSCKQ